MKKTKRSIHHSSGQRNVKGQMEVFGLIVIVVIIALGFFFYTAFKLREKPISAQRAFIYKELPNNLVVSMMDIEVAQCPAFSVKDLLKDCATSKTINCAGANSCTAANTAIGAMLDVTLKQQGYPYYFSTKGLSTNPSTEIKIGTDCKTAKYKNTDAGTTLIPLYPQSTGTIVVKLDICS